jgi:hypothetical protein
MHNSALCGVYFYFQRLLWSHVTFWNFKVNRIGAVIADNLAGVIFHHFKPLSHNLHIWQIFATCGYLPRCGNCVLAQILPRVVFPPTVCKCDTSRTNRRCLFCYQFQTSLQIRIFAKSMSDGKRVANVRLTSCIMYNYGRIFQVPRNWDNGFISSENSVL